MFVKDIFFYKTNWARKVYRNIHIYKKNSYPNFMFQSFLVSSLFSSYIILTLNTKKIVMVALFVLIPRVYNSKFLILFLEFCSRNSPAGRMCNSRYLHDYHLQYSQMVVCCGIHKISTLITIITGDFLRWT